MRGAHSGMEGWAGCLGGFGYGYEKCTVHIQHICKKEDMVIDK